MSGLSPDFDALFPVDDYLYFLDETLREENTSRQVDFLAATLGLASGARVADLGCGHGRHALELARRGVRVLGIDLVEGFVARARASAAMEGLDVDFVHGDLRGLRPASPLVDHALCLFDAFGYFDDEGQREVLASAAALVEPGGALVLDVRNRDFVLRVPPVTALQKGDDFMIDRHQFDMVSGRLVDRRSMVRDGRVRHMEFSVRLYTVTEIRWLLEGAGFVVESIYGGFEAAPPSLARSRVVVVARRA